MWQLLEIPLHYLQIDALPSVWPLQFLQKQGVAERLTGNQALRHAQELQIARPPGKQTLSFLQNQQSSYAHQHRDECTDVGVENQAGQRVRRGEFESNGRIERMVSPGYRTL